MRRVQKKWKIAYMIAKKDRPLAGAITELKDKVVEAARKLEQQLASSAAQRAFREADAALEPARKVHMEATARWAAECEQKEKDIAKLYKRIDELWAKVRRRGASASNEDY